MPHDSLGARAADLPVGVAPAAVDDLAVDVVTDDEGFDGLEREWTALAARAPGAHYFHGYQWCRRIWQCMAAPRGRSLHVVVVREGGRLVVVWPLMIDGRSLRSLSSDSFEYRDLLVDAGDRRHEWMDAAWRAARALGGVDLMLFQNVRGPSNVVALLERRARAVWMAEDKRSLVIRLQGFADWAAYEASLPKRLMSDQRRQWRRLDEAGPGTRFDIVDDEADIDATVDFLVDHKIAWLGTRGLAAGNFGAAEYREFLKRSARDARAERALVLARLCAGERLVSAGLALRRGGELTFLMFAYDFAWEKYSPSRLLLERLIRWCFEQRIAVFDFMPGGGDYKETWTNDGVASASYIVPVGLRGHAIRAWYAADLAALVDRSFLKRVYVLLPQRARAAVYRGLSRRKLVGLGFIAGMRELPRHTIDFRGG